MLDLMDGTDGFAIPDGSKTSGAFGKARKYLTDPLVLEANIKVRQDKRRATAAPSVPIRTVGTESRRTWADDRRAHHSHFWCKVHRINCQVSNSSGYATGNSAKAEESVCVNQGELT